MNLSREIGEVCVGIAQVEAERKDMKSHYRFLVETLRVVVEEGPESLPLIDPPKPSASQNEAWRAVSIRELQMPPSVLGVFEEADISTLGELSKAIEGERWWDEFEGIGEGKAEKVAEAFCRFWGSHPEYTPDDSPAPDAAAVPKMVRSTVTLDGGPEAGDEVVVHRVDEDGVLVWCYDEDDDPQEFLLRHGEFEVI